MTARIRQVQLRNFKSFERAVVDLEPLTVLVGPNGAGKSNFVEALVFVQRCLDVGVDQAFLAQGRPLPTWLDPERPDSTVGLRLSIELENATKAEYALELRAGLPYESQVVRERCWISVPGNAASFFEVRNGHFVQGIPGIRPQMAAGRLALFAASAADEFRPLYDFLTSVRYYSISPDAVRKPGTSRHQRLALEATGANAAAVLLSLEDEDPDAKARVVRLLGQAVEGISDVKAWDLRDSLFLAFFKEVGLPQPAMLLHSEVSDGTLRLLGLLLAVYQPNRPSLLAIEEPEATVHPAIADLVLQVLADAAADRQVLITTHSPDILDAKELSEEQIRVVVQRHGRSIVAPLGRASRQAVRERLYTPGELLRLNELDEDIEAAEKAAAGLDLFGFGPGAEQSAA